MEVNMKKKRPRNQNPQPFLSEDHDSVVSSKKPSRGSKKHQEDEKLVSSVLTSKILQQAPIQPKEVQDEDDERHRQDSGIKLKFPEELGGKLHADGDDDSVDGFDVFSETQSQFRNYEEGIDEEDEKLLAAFFSKDVGPQRTLADLIFSFGGEQAHFAV